MALTDRSTSHFAIPSKAVVRITDKGADGDTGGFACQYKPTISEIRRQFRAAHELRDGDLEGGYTHYPCYRTGIIAYKDKTYYWKLGEDHLIETDWPDGKSRTMGGTETEYLSGGVRGRKKLVSTPSLLYAVSFKQPDCPYLPDFKVLQAKLPHLSAQEAIAALERYDATHDSPYLCEATKLYRLLEEQESKLIRLVVNGSSISPQSIYRCTSFDAKTSACNGLFADDTAHPFSMGIKFLPTPASDNFSVVCAIKGASFRAAYKVAPGALLDGGPATPLTADHGVFRLHQRAKGIAFIAIFKTPGLWPYRKAVWYF